MFAKILEHDVMGQILVVKKTNDEGMPGIEYTVELGNDATISCTGSSDDTDEGWLARDVAFEKCDNESATRIIDSLCDAIGIEVTVKADDES